MTRIDVIPHLVWFRDAERAALMALAPGLAKARARKLLPLGQECTLKAGEELVRDGESSRFLMVLLEGTCLAQKGGLDLATLGHGAIIGEIAYATGAPATATVLAGSDCRIFRFDSQKLRQLLGANSDSAAEIGPASAAVMRARLQAITEQLASRRQGGD